MKFRKPFYRHDRGLWYVQLDGKQHNLGADRQEAFELYKKLIADRQRAAPVMFPLVANVLDAFLDWLSNRVTEGTKAKRTFDWHHKYLQSFITFKNDSFTAAALTIDKLEPLHVYQWADSHAGWKNSRRGALTSVQRAFSWAAKAGALKAIGGRSPLAHLEKPPAGRREQLVTEEEYREVLTCLRRPETRDLVRLSWDSGMRPHELFTCEARFFEPENARLVFPVELSKGKKTQRVVYLNDAALAIVTRLARKNPVGALLRNADGMAWNAGSVNCLFQRVRRELGRRRLRLAGLMPVRIKRLTARERKDEPRRVEHDKRVLDRREQVRQLAWTHGTKYSLYAFRHAFCTEALENGIDAVTVSVLMGHRDTTMISRHYAHVHQRHDHMRRAANTARSSSA